MNDWNERALKAAKRLSEVMPMANPYSHARLLQEACQLLLDGVSQRTGLTEEKTLPDSEGPWWMWVAFTTGSQWRMTHVYRYAPSGKTFTRWAFHYPMETVRRDCQAGRWIKATPPGIPA